MNVLEFKGLNALRILGCAKDKFLCGPQTIYIDINTNCNINCIYCWIHSPLNKTHPKKKIMDYKKFKQIIYQAKAWGTEEIVISGDGEPMLHPDILKMINLVKKFNMVLTLTTNATFKRNLLQAISKVDRLYITFSAINKENYSKIQAPNNKNMFSQVINNLYLLGRIKNKRNKPFLDIAFIINKKNYKDVIPMLRLVKGLNIDRVTFRMMEPTKYTKSLLLNKNEQKELEEIILQTDPRNLKIKNNLNAILQGLIKYEKSPYRLKSCYSGWFNLFVDFNENVGLCCHNEKYIVGNIKEAPLEDIWKKSFTHDMRLKGKYEFDLKDKLWKDECIWCHWAEENNLIQKEIERLNENRFKII
jgi:MoaA/NifB/PqqE/SkfB family radical SAM enzyme